MIEVRKTARYTEWFESLSDRQTRARIEVRVFRLSHGNLGRHRVLTDGIVEMKIDFGPGYRVYFARRGAELLLLLLTGGDKTSQQRDIAAAIQLAKDWKS